MIYFDVIEMFYFDECFRYECPTVMSLECLVSLRGDVRFSEHMSGSVRITPLIPSSRVKKQYEHSTQNCATSIKIIKKV